jgi:hypothetical protein
MKLIEIRSTHTQEGLFDLCSEHLSERLEVVSYLLLVISRTTGRTHVCELDGFLQQVVLHD